jgi:glycosyltransferase involved in cell wall biosynthesis
MKNKIIFFWEGFPVCALLLTLIKKEYGKNLQIVATKPNVNFPDFELDYPYLDILWLDKANDIWNLKDQYSDFNFVIHTGWKHTGWNKYSDYLKKKNNAKLIFTVDNIFINSPKQYLGAIYFRIFLKNKYNAVFVPGNRSTKFLNFLGMPSNKIFTGYYGAFEEIYFESSNILSRNCEFFFIGQLISRKGLIILLEAYKLYRKKGGNWTLRISGNGPLEYLCHNLEGVYYDGFLSPKDCTVKMNNSRCLILPSNDEHWGTVVCEAAATGMMLLLSNCVGSSDDILRNGINGLIFENNSISDLENKMSLISNWDDKRVSHASQVSISISKGFNSLSFYNGLISMIETISYD